MANAKLANKSLSARELITRAGFGNCQTPLAFRFLPCRATRLETVKSRPNDNSMMPAPVTYGVASIGLFIWRCDNISDQVDELKMAHPKGQALLTLLRFADFLPGKAGLEILTLAVTTLFPEIVERVILRGPQRMIR